MTITYNEIVSQIQNTLRTLNKDQYIPRRYILSVFKSKAEFLMAQKFHDKSLFRETNLYKWLECVDMIEMDKKLCNKMEIPSCEKAVKSKKKLPKLLWTRYGSTVLMVTNIDHSKEYQVVSLSYYNTIKRKSNFDKFKGKYAIIYPDNTLVIPDSTVKKVNVLMYSLDEKFADSSDCDKSSLFDTEDDGGNCNNYWESEIELSDKVSELAIAETLKTVSMRLQVKEDENPNLDSNIISREQ